ncbi:hypothetical protein F4819DRAFT_188929 [Hypoxylon fuscum]|nr:hypothetical protein F4819DRAFT_188929 [Hypoxylon fuscum]
MSKTKSTTSADWVAKITINEIIDPASGLRSPLSTHYLNQIEKIRANGINISVSSPQLIVCGETCSGVLERLTEILFSQMDDYRTGFPTEIVLRHRTCLLPVTGWWEGGSGI